MTCEELEAALRIQSELRSRTRNEIILRAFLRAIGFEWLYDLLIGKGLDWDDFFDLLTMLDVAAAIAWLAGALEKVGLTGIAQELLKKLGPWALIFLIAFIVIEIVTAIQKWNDFLEDFNARLKQLYDGSDCPNKDDLFKKYGLDIPK